jgi:hypothetical protein
MKISEKQELLDKIRRLESDIYMLENQLISIAPGDFEEIVRPWKLPPDFNPYRWSDEAAAKIIKKTMVVYPEGRAPCPLCNRHPDQHEGYALPVGLERHLTGKLGYHQCYVFGAAQKRLTDDWNRDRREKHAATEDSRIKDELKA